MPKITNLVSVSVVGREEGSERVFEHTIRLQKEMLSITEILEREGALPKLRTLLRDSSKGVIEAQIAHSKEILRSIRKEPAVVSK